MAATSPTTADAGMGMRDTAAARAREAACDGDALTQTIESASGDGPELLRLEKWQQAMVDEGGGYQFLSLRQCTSGKGSPG